VSMRKPYFRTAVLALSFFCFEPSSRASPTGTIRGYARYPRIVGNPASGYVELYEWNLFLCPVGGKGIGPSRRLGAPPGEPARGDGFYEIAISAGLVSLFVTQPTFYGRPAVVPGVWIQAGRTVTRNISPAIDFCCAFTENWSLPWGESWYQTFVAKGTSITGVSFRLAGTSAGTVEVSVISGPQGVSPSLWTPVSGAASKTTPVKALADNWVRWRSGEVPTVPGRTYAVRLKAVGGGSFSPFSRPKDSLSYRLGRAYDGAGNPRNEDLNITVFSDSDSVRITYCKATPGLGELRDGYFGTRWGQTFKAQGRFLAAVDVWAAGADRNWDLDFTFTVRRGGPAGPRIGPAKTTKAAYQAFGAGLHGVCYVPGEVPLLPGETYYIEFTNPQGFNPYVMTDPQDSYRYGAAYQDGRLKDGGTVDLAMTILEYPGGNAELRGTVRSEKGQAVAGALLVIQPGPYAATSASNGSFSLPGLPGGTYSLLVEAPGFERLRRSGLQLREGESTNLDLTLRPLTCSRPFTNGGFEDSLSGWTRYGNAKPDVVQGKWFADIEPAEGRYFQGNAVDGTALGEGGYFQQFCAEPGHLIRIEAESNVYWIGGDPTSARNRLGFDPTGGTSPEAETVTWSPWHQHREAVQAWRTLTVEGRATSPLVTVFLHFSQSNPPGSRWHINCFDGVKVTDVTAQQAPKFRRGDANSDGKIDVADPVFVLQYLFSSAQADCLSALDAQDDGSVDIADAVYLLGFLFAAGPEPSPPGLSCGADPTPDGLDCKTPQC